MLHYCVNIISLYVLLLWNTSPSNDDVVDDDDDDDDDNNNSGPRHPHCWSFEIKDTPHSVGLLWTGDRAVA